MAKTDIEKIGKYRVKHEIGRGNQAIVYLCEDPFVGRDVAVKLFTSSHAKVGESTAMRRKLFFNEVRTTGRLRHPNILPTLDAGEHGEDWYLVTEYLDGARQVSEFCTPDSLLPVPTVMQLLFKAARALDHAHRQGVVHRDIKPGNLMLTPDGNLWICDFGIALDAVADTTEIGVVMGSPSYMSPEQVQGERVTSQSDLFSLGVVAYELLTGRRPFRGKSLKELVANIVGAKPEPPSSIRAGVTPMIDLVVERALSKTLKQRYRSGAEFASELVEAGAHFERVAGDVAEQERFEMVKGLDFFKEFSYGEIWEVLRASEWLRVGIGEQIITEGEIDDCFYVLASGHAEVTHEGNRVAALKPGDCFGEMALIGKPRTASINASSACDMLKMRFSRLGTLSAQTQLRFTSVFLLSLVKRLADSPQR